MSKSPRAMDPHAVGTAIRRARLSRRMSQAKLARRLGVTQGAISFWERGIERPTFLHLLKLGILFPELADLVYADQADLIRRIEQLERAVRDGRCGCHGCSCGQAAS